MDFLAADSSTPRDALIRHLEEHAVRTDGPFTLRSGEVSNWYIDARQTTFSGSGARLVGAAVLAEVPAEVVAVGGMTMGADPIAVATVVVGSEQGRDLVAFSVRKEAKDHGVGGRLVGPVSPGDRVLVLEDTTTTGSALVEAITALIDEGVIIAKAVSVVDRSGGVVETRMDALEIPYVALVTPEDLGVEEL